MKSKKINRAMAASEHANAVRVDFNFNRSLMDRAAQQAFDSFCAGARWAEANKWIPVKEELPQIDADVLVVIDDTVQNSVVAYFNGDEWHDTIEGQPLKVTHWMPIPPTPKRD